MPGIFARLGSFARSIITRVIETGRTIAETVGFLKPMVPEVTAAEVAEQYGRVAIEEAHRGAVYALGEHIVIPDSLHVETDIPFKRPYAYKVVAYGRYQAGVERKGRKVGGQFGHEEWDLTTNRQLTKAEIEDMARSRLGKRGGSPIMEVFSVEVVAAYFREEE